MTVHRHLWHSRSTHLTGDGVVRYESCPCGRWRILAAEVTLSEIAGSPVATSGPSTRGSSAEQ